MTASSAKLNNLLQGVAQPWQCDVLGHLTTRFYMAMFDDASYHLLHQAFGWPGNRDESGQLAFVDVRHEIDYQSEVSAGDLLDVSAGVLRVGGKSIVVRYCMNNLSKGKPAARLDSTMVLFDTTAREGVKLSKTLREKAQACLVRISDSR